MFCIITIVLIWLIEVFSLNSQWGLEQGIFQSVSTHFAIRVTVRLFLQRLISFYFLKLCVPLSSLCILSLFVHFTHFQQLSSVKALYKQELSTILIFRCLPQSWVMNQPFLYSVKRVGTSLNDSSNHWASSFFPSSIHVVCVRVGE